MATYSPADFPEGGRFHYGQQVRIHLYDAVGRMIGTIKGKLYAREENVNVSRLEDGPPVYKTLYWVKEIEGYERPHPELPDVNEKVEEGWFAEQDIEPLPESPVSWLATQRN